MSKQHKEPTKFLARISGNFDVDPLDSDEILPGDQLVIVSVVKVKSVGTEDEESSGEARWVSTLKVRSAGIVRDEFLLERLAEDLGLAAPQPKLPFPPTFVAPPVTEDDDDDDPPVPAAFVPASAIPAPVNTDDALRAFLSADV